MLTINPVTEESHELPETPLDEIPVIVSASHAAHVSWSELDLSKRISLVRKVAERIVEKREHFVCTLMEDVGKTRAGAEREVDRTFVEIDFYCNRAAEWLSPEDAEGGFVQFDSLGTVAVISPWNFPLLVPFRGITPALLAGNCVVFKPSEHSLLTGISIDQVFSEIDEIPVDVFQSIIGGKDHGASLVNDNIQMVSFTGSTGVGKSIMRASAERLTRVQLELGGMDAAIVLKDADINATAKAVVNGNCRNTGQVCCSIKRVYVENDIYDQFVAAAAAESSNTSFGEPEGDADMGPLVGKFQRDKVASIVDDARLKGATVHSGGEVPQRKGYFYPSTILTEVTDDMRVLAEEPFGPVLPIIAVSSWQEAVEKANDSPYGLTGSVWTQDLELGQSVASKLEVGVAKVNSHGPGPLGTPWGGAKQSGIGRMATKEGVREFVNTKMVHINSAA